VTQWVTVAIPVVAGVIAWFANEWRKRAGEERQRREDRYRRLLEHSRGFYVATQNEADKAKFLEEVNLSWLYCPDEIIHAMYAFLATVRTGAPSSESDREETFGDLVLAMRKDLWSLGLLRRTKLTATDYRHFQPSETSRAVSSR